MAKELHLPPEPFEFSPIERGWIAHSLGNMISVLMRARNKEQRGSEIYVLRGKEIDQLEALKRRFLL